jgi:pimeloyl-ACP methyl ester carboxylesterase
VQEILTDLDLGALEAARLELPNPPPRLPPVSRIELMSGEAPTVSALQWRRGSPLLVFLHGGFENAHVWDLVSILLDRPLIAIDLPGCGSSERVERGTYWPPDTSRLLSHVLRQVAPHPIALVGLSYGGLVALSLLDEIPDCISQLILLDVLPGSALEHANRVVHWLEERPSTWSFAELEARWAKLHPHRSTRFRRQQIISSHMGQRDALVPNADCRPERWVPIPRFDHLWQTLHDASVPVSLLRAGRSRVVSDEHVDRLLSLRPDAFVHTFHDSGHHLPIHTPHALASVLAQRIPESAV